MMTEESDATFDESPKVCADSFWELLDREGSGFIVLANLESMLLANGFDEAK